MPRTLRGPGEPERVASYTLRAQLDPDTHRIEGRQTVRWRNTSRRPVSELCFHLYLNAFAHSGTSWLRREGAEEIARLAPGGWGWTEVRRLEVAGREVTDGLRYAAPDDGNPDDRTLARVALPQPVAPGDEVVIGAEFVSQLPRVVARTGFDGDFHLAAQWFPKLGVLARDGTWNCHQFHYASEFFADYGDYDVAITLPRRFVVGATGERVGEPVVDGRLATHRYVQHGVHDFAWTAWPEFVERRRVFRRPGLPEVEITLLLRPETVGFAERYFTALEHGLELFGTWYGPYPYSTLTMVDPPWGARQAGGMEYPTFITTGTRVLSPRATQDPESVTVHELGHQWFYGLLASDEAQESWLDEGLTTYATARVLAAAYGPETWAFRAWGAPVVLPGVTLEHPHDVRAGYFRRPTTDPVTRTTWGYLDKASYRAGTYSKTALALAQLERLLGAEVMERAMRAYATAWRFRQPTHHDFVRTLSQAAGEDLGDYFRQTLGSAEVLDYGVERVSTQRRRSPRGVLEPGAEPAPGEALPGWQSEVVVRRLGAVQLPVLVELVFADGQSTRVRWDGRDRWVRFRVRGPRLLWAEVDPDETLLLDVDRLNNSRRVEPERRASRRWAQRARFWIQNLLEVAAALA
ncbi:MAG TPA: M1 family metallopeptidase [Thermoanaerobaculia bacterium]|nr:M1 family metallopeptidase [Thermoanaerobaculia bacterium]